MATTVVPLFPASLDSEFHPYRAGAPGRSHLVRSGDVIQDAIDAADDGDRVFIGPGAYDEALDLTSKKEFSVLGAGPFGSVSIEPTAANATAILIDGLAGSSGRARDIYLHNLGLDAPAGGIGLHVRGNVRNVTAERCKLEADEGDGVAARLESMANAIGSIARTRIVNSQLTNAATLLQLRVSGAGNPVTQTVLRGCELDHYSLRGVHVDTVHATDLDILGNTFKRQENGNEPSDEYALAAVAGTTGHVDDNFFPTAINGGKISLAAGMIWGANRVINGWATAAPS